MFDGIVLIDGGAPEGALEDVYQRLAGYNRTIVLGTGTTVEQSEVMPIGFNDSLAAAVAGLLSISGFDTGDPSLVSAPVQGMDAVVVGPDYFDRVQIPVVTGTTVVPTTTSIG